MGCCKGSYPFIDLVLYMWGSIPLPAIYFILLVSLYSKTKSSYLLVLGASTRQAIFPPIVQEQETIVLRTIQCSCNRCWVDQFFICWHGGTEDTLALGASGRNPMRVQILLPVPILYHTCRQE